jgi:osmotically-inducible protein OsmY
MKQLIRYFSQESVEQAVDLARGIAGVSSVKNDTRIK